MCVLVRVCAYASVSVYIRFVRKTIIKNMGSIKSNEEKKIGHVQKRNVKAESNPLMKIGENKCGDL